MKTTTTTTTTHILKIFMFSAIVFISCSDKKNEVNTEGEVINLLLSEQDAEEILDSIDEEVAEFEPPEGNWREYDRLRETMTHEEAVIHMNNIDEEVDSDLILERVLLDYLTNTGPNLRGSPIMHYQGTLFTGIGYKFFPNGSSQLNEEFIFKDGKYNGVWKEWHGNGQLKQERYYLDGERNGKETKWLENGQLRNEGNYKDDKKDGLFKRYHKNGQLMREDTFRNGKRESEKSKEYDENGQFIRSW
jgi:antitoxin component YwqK of YwqJK toxin-antitoxin module